MNIHSRLGIASLITSALFAVTLPAQGNGSGGGGGGNNTIIAYIQTLPLETVSPAEHYLLDHMREEEKLARDVYRTLYQQWQLPIFQNIAQSEQNHMDLVLHVMQRYQLPDPVPNNQVGSFSDPMMTWLYQFGVNFGSQSLMHALLVGCVVEDLDIFDLDVALAYSDNTDLDVVWQNLQKGSRNHMRAFYPQLVNQGLTYPGLYLAPAAILAIVNSPMEPGAVDENGDPL